VKSKREEGESYGEVRRERKWKGGVLCGHLYGGGVFSYPFCVCGWGYIIPNYKNFYPRKFSLQRKRFGYVARMSSSISQAESPEVRSHMTLTISISFPRSCFIWESKILIGITSKERFSFTCTECDSRMWLGSGTYFLSWDTWKMLWILGKGGGKGSIKDENQERRRRELWRSRKREKVKRECFMWLSLSEWGLFLSFSCVWMALQYQY